MTRFLRWLHHLIWATPEESARFDRIDQEIGR